MVAIHAFGPTAWFVDDLDDPAAWALGLETLALPGIDDVVPAEDTVVVICEREHHRGIGRRLAEVPAIAVDEAAPEVLLGVTYDGEDLSFVADAAGIDERAVIDLHSSAVYRVAFCGFSPGFAYLAGLPPALHLVRRERPRTRVPAGSVAIAAHYSAVYPSASPGGWHLLGHTDAPIWDERRTPPSRLTPGTIVRFRAR